VTPLYFRKKLALTSPTSGGRSIGFARGLKQRSCYYPLHGCSGLGFRRADHATPLYPQTLALTSPTSGGRSVGIVRLRTQATESSYFSWMLHVLWNIAREITRTSLHRQGKSSRPESRSTQDTNPVNVMYCVHTAALTELNLLQAYQAWL
jgi:hypothetical protein